MGVTSEDIRATAEGSLSRLVLEYSVTMKRLVDAAKRKWAHEQAKPPPPEITVDTQPARETP